MSNALATLLWCMENYCSIQIINTKLNESKQNKAIKNNGN